MVAVGPEKIYRSSKRFNGIQHDDVLIFKFPTPLIYANQSRYVMQMAVIHILNMWLKAPLL